MYKLTFNRQTINDLLDNRSVGRQMYGAIIIPYSGVFSHKSSGNQVQPPKIVCPYQVNDIIAIQERWARSSSSYVYATGNENEDYGYDFRPAYTMPLDAVRMYGRIVSIKPWRATKAIIKNYLSRGMSSDSYAGTAKVIGYADKGNELLSSIRKQHNRSVLNKTGQPLIPKDPPMVIKNVPYYLREPVKYQLNYLPDSQYGQVTPTLVTRDSITSSYAQSYNDDIHIIKTPTGDTTFGNITLDYYYGDWVWSPMTRLESQEYLKNNPDKGLLERGTYYYSSDSGTTVYVYIYLDDKGNPIPRYRYYKTEIVDPSKYWFVWLVSAYLCNENGDVIGNWF